jgi:hypothetical protein
MEALVGTLRGEKLANPSSVKVYIQTIEGLSIRLNNMDYYSYPVRYAQEHLQNINGEKCASFFKKGENQQKLQPFANVCKVLLQMCNLVVLCAQEKAKQDEASRMQS